jgi:uncharacterized damage-inducible protein DinB
MSDKPITPERLLRILDSQAQKTAHAIAGLDAAAFDEVARDDGWTARDVLGHIASGYEGLLALAQNRVPGELEPETFDLDIYNELRRHQARRLSLAELLDWLDAARRAMREYIEQCDEADYAGVVHVPWMGDHPRGQFLMFPALHEGGHRAQLEQWRAQREGPQP